MSQPHSAADRPRGPMQDLTPLERRQWHAEIVRAPRLRYGLPARLLFRFEDLLFGAGRSLPKFRALEIIDRVAYQAWEQAAYYLAGKLSDRSVRARHLHDSVLDHRAEQDNEESHVLILDELITATGERESWFRFRLLPQFVALVVFQQFWLLRVVRPAWAFRFNADIEDHAEHEYAHFAAEHPEWEDVPFRSLAAPEYGSYESLADLIRQIGHDEGVHKQASLDRMAQVRAVTRPRPSG